MESDILRQHSLALSHWLHKNLQTPHSNGDLESVEYRFNSNTLCPTLIECGIQRRNTLDLIRAADTTAGWSVPLLLDPAY